MSLNHNEQLEHLQTEYRRAWNHYAAEVESLQTGLEGNVLEGGQLAIVQERVELAAAEYRAARDEMALFLLDAIESEKESAFAVCQSAA
jgi:hypothetical protein